MTEKSLSQQLCEACGIEPKYLVKYTYFGQQENIYETLEEAKQEKEMLKGEIEEAYPDFENNNNNKFKLIDLLIENDHFITLSKDYYAIGNGDNDFVDDCYNEYFEVEGDSFLEALHNYLIRWIKQSTSFRKEDGTMSEYIDTSHTLEREDCYYSRGFDEYLKDIERIKQAIKNEQWEV